MEKRISALQQTTPAFRGATGAANERVDALEWPSMTHRPFVLATLLALVTPLFLVSSERTAHAQGRAEFPTLERAIQLARARAIVVNDAQGELGVAHAQMAGARASALGNPYVEVQVDQGVPKNSTQELSAIAYAYFPVEIGGQRGARIDEAERLIKWREIGVNDARGIASGEVVAAYGELVVGAARITEATAGEQTARDEAKYFAGRLEAKDTTVYEKSLADAEVARWVQSRAEAQLRYSAARARFSQVTGAMDLDNPPAHATVGPPRLRGAWDDPFVARVVDHSPLVSRLTAERSYWDASVDRYKTERMPPVAFELIGGRGAAGEARLGGGVVVTFPVTRRYQGEIARAEQGRTHAVSRLALYRGIVESRLRAARDAILTVNKAVEELDQAGMPALERAVSSSVEGFKTGKIEITRVLLARRDLAIARTRRLDLIEAGWRAYADLTVLSGELP
jgi:cobalt-zinc-cadmium efflux system outer membrane protein